MGLIDIPLPLKHAPTPRIEHFALLTGLEAAVRASIVSVLPLLVFQTLGDKQQVSLNYLAAGVAALCWGLMVPAVTQILPRRWAYTGGCLLYLLAMVLAVLDQSWSVPLALICASMATATTYVCLSAYVLDYVDRAALGRSQSLQLFYAAAPWTVGPALGVWLFGLWRPLPFLVAGGFVLVLLVVFWVLRLGNGRQLQRARRPAINPLGYLGRFFRQPRLIAGWLMAVIRSSGWWIFMVYLPIFCVENGLGDKVAGLAYSLSNGFLFLSPLIGRAARRISIRRALRGAFLCGGVLMMLAFLLAPVPLAVVVVMFLATFFFVVLDVIGSLPFLVAVRPAERTEMSAVFASFRDVSGIGTPALAWTVLFFAPVQAIFALGGLAYLAGWALAGNLHPRIGTARPSRGGAP